MYKIGDIVRLKRGWTPLCVIGFDTDGDVIARYCNRYHDPITEQNYKHPTREFDYIRPQDAFVPWDGKPLTMKVLKPMSKRYKTIQNSGTSKFGRLLVVDGNNFVLKMDNGEIHEFTQDQLTEDIPFTFEVRSISQHKYRCHYSLPAGVGHVCKGDVLLSNSGNIYVVIRVDTKDSNPKGVFEGTRFVQKNL